MGYSFDGISMIPDVLATADLDQPQAAAAIDELRFWLPIMQQHAMLIRNGFDLAEEGMFRYADGLASAIGPVISAVDAAAQGYVPGRAECCIAECNRVIVPLREFKVELEKAIKACRVHTDRPDGLIDHVRREADLFLGIVNGLVGGPVPTRRDLELPVPESELSEAAALAPRLLIPVMCERRDLVLRDEIVFFAEINAEHAAVLGIYFRPCTQEQLREETVAYGDALSKLHGEMGAAIRAGKRLCDMCDILKRMICAVRAWVAQMKRLQESIGTCAVPTGEVNFPYSLLDHMTREANYTLDLLGMTGA